MYNSYLIFVRFSRLELSEVARGYDVEVLPLIFLISADLEFERGDIKI